MATFILPPRAYRNYQYVRGIRLCVAVLATALIVIMASLPASSEGATTELISVSSSGEQADGPSTVASVSRDGRRVLFSSDATNLVANDTNGRGDAFVRDVVSGWTRRVSVKTGGAQTSGIAVNLPAMSGNGRWVVFVSEDDSISPGDDNDATDVFLHDLRNRETIRVTQAPQNAPDDFGSGADPSISYNGRFVTFRSGRRYVRKDRNYETDVYVWDRSDRSVELVSLTDYGTPSNDYSGNAHISADGGCVTFSSYASLDWRFLNNHVETYVHDLRRGGTRRVSLSTKEKDEQVTATGVLDGDGDNVGLFSNAENLVSEDNGLTPDVYRRDIGRGTTSLLSEQDGKMIAGRGISLDGNGDRAAMTLDEAETVDGYIDYVDNRVVVRDLRRNVSRRIDKTSGADSPNGRSEGALISLDGSAVAFTSYASNLVAGDENAQRDVFLRQEVFAPSGWSPQRRPDGCAGGLPPREPPRCFGQPAIWIGTSRSEIIRGNRWRNVIHGKGSGDLITGSRWNILCGGRGNDEVSGGPQDDYLGGGPGDDELRGNDGFDVCHGGPGIDKAYGCEKKVDIP